MSILVAILLSIVQGLGEFLPISGSGHLVLVEHIFHVQENNAFFNSMLHFGSLCAIVLSFRSTLWKMIRHPFSKMSRYVLLSALPTLAIAILFRKRLGTLINGRWLGVCFLITAVILFVCVRIPRQKRELSSMNWYEPLFLGTLQGIALPPGISRSGITIMGGLVEGFNSNSVIEFSFLMSIPAILISVIMDAIQIPAQGISVSFLAPSIIGMIITLLTGLFAINLMMHVMRKVKLSGFAVYCALLGLFVLVDQNFTHFFF